MKQIKDEPLDWLDIEINETKWSIKELQLIFRDTTEEHGKKLVEIGKRHKFIPENVQDFAEALIVYPHFYSKAERIYLKKSIRYGKTINHLLDL